jgi:hypothetical protein
VSASDINIQDLAKSIDRMLKRRGIKDVRLGALSLHPEGVDADRKCWDRVKTTDENGNQIYEWVEVPCR